jgi:tRNA (guanine-N7-)-methyltransferase
MERTGGDPDGRSRAVSSRQRDVHPRLGAIVEAHLARPWRAPLHRPSLAAFAALRRELDGASVKLVLDSGCGNGESTRQIAEVFPDCLVIGVDRSIERLRRGGIDRFPYREGNAVWLRAELATFWRLAVAAGWRLQRHYLLYPNPWPKPAQLRRRWHAHPVFPDLLRLGGRLELRCNWEVYAREFACAANRVLGTQAQPVALNESAELDELAAAGARVISSPFERKYRASGHRLYSLEVSCGAGSSATDSCGAGSCGAV